MLHAASKALSEIKHDNDYAILPNIKDAAEASRKIAFAVATVARESNLATIDGDIDKLIDNTCWQPKYLEYMKI